MSFFQSFFSDIYDNLKIPNLEIFEQISKLFMSASELDKKIIFVGNGGSSTIAGHLSIDCINAAGLKAINFNDPGLITCFSNDYGYENWISKALDSYADIGDTLVLISSSGESKNMINAAHKAISLGLTVVTLTGFKKNNTLSLMGDINLWANSVSYNHVESAHQTWILSIVDYIISTKVSV